MTLDEKNRIISLRQAGRTLTEIADETGIPRNTIKTFCRRQRLTSDNAHAPVDVCAEKTCLCCHKSIIQYPGRKEKKFCSDSCRMKYWNAHTGDMKCRSQVEFVCPVCGARYSDYAVRNRKYCSRDCYMLARFGCSVCK